MDEKNPFRGLELLFKVIQGKLQSKEDCVIAALHTLLINKGNKCVGLGDDWDNNSPSELLPDNWNSNQEIYTIRYISSSSGNKYLMKSVKAGNSLLVNLVNINEEKASGMTVNVGAYVSDDFKDFTSAFKDLDQLSKTFQQEIVQKVRPKSSDRPGTSKEENPGPRSTLPDDQDPYIYEDYAHPSSLQEPQRVAFPSVGRGDLDPLGSGYGGGMLFDPSSMMGRPQPDLGIGGPRLPRGAIPPGARFDPFGPPSGRGRGGLFNPDPDHMPMPGFDDAFI